MKTFTMFCVGIAIGSIVFILFVAHRSDPATATTISWEKPVTVEIPQWSDCGSFPSGEDALRYLDEQHDLTPYNWKLRNVLRSLRNQHSHKALLPEGSL